MTRIRAPSAEERALWRRATSDVAPLQPARPAPDDSRAVPAQTRHAADPGTAKPPTDAPAKPRVSRSQPPAAPPPAVQPRLAPGETAGLDRRTADRLRQGRLAIDARLDLHGMTQGQAHGALLRFLERCHADGRRVLLVITGKGTPRLATPTPGAEPDFDTAHRRTAGVLRNRLPGWLADPPLAAKILAVHPARPRHGGDGAFYVLLKRRR